VGEYGDFRRKKINQACLTKFWLLSYEWNNFEWYKLTV
jgi:hypothetical protein